MNDIRIINERQRAKRDGLSAAEYAYAGTAYRAPRKHRWVWAALVVALLYALAVWL